MNTRIFKLSTKELMLKKKLGDVKRLTSTGDLNSNLCEHVSAKSKIETRICNY